ncbi:rho-related GTP-binding protein RhoB-like protein [Mycena olivaceomarginata]|nr:rho-related GTP-binding protein RhoB-like protein [Mycena olivaceomarginata]
MIIPRRKLVLVGEACGKTSLLTLFARGNGGTEYVVSDLEVDAVYDPDQLRPLCYTGVDVFLLCFAADGPASLRNVQKKWIQEVRHFCPDVPFVLVGCKTDMRDDPLVFGRQAGYIRRPIEAEKAAQKYVACSAKLKEAVNEVFRGHASEYACSGP